MTRARVSRTCARARCACGENDADVDHPARDARSAATLVYVFAGVDADETTFLVESLTSALGTTPKARVRCSDVLSLRVLGRRDDGGGGRRAVACFGAERRETTRRRDDETTRRRDDETRRRRVNVMYDYARTRTASRPPSGGIHPSMLFLDRPKEKK